MAKFWEKTLTAGAIKNGNIGFKTCPFTIDSIYVGGTNRHQPAQKTLTVTFKPGSTSQQWLYGDKMLFANRNPHTKNFFERIHAKEGAVIRITKTSDDALIIEKGA